VPIKSLPNTYQDKAVRSYNPAHFRESSGLVGKEYQCELAQYKIEAAFGKRELFRSSFAPFDCHALSRRSCLGNREHVRAEIKACDCAPRSKPRSDLSSNDPRSTTHI
jgi:hypothetical protein